MDPALLERVLKLIQALRFSCGLMAGSMKETASGLLFPKIRRDAYIRAMKELAEIEADLKHALESKA